MFRSSNKEFTLCTHKPQHLYIPTTLTPAKSIFYRFKTLLTRKNKIYNKKVVLLYPIIKF